MTKIHKDDAASPVWRRIKAQIADDIDRALGSLEKTSDHTKVLRLQGRIAALRDLISAVEDVEASRQKASIFPDGHTKSPHGSLY